MTDRHKTIKARSFQLSGDFSVTFNMTAHGVKCIWAPRLPGAEELEKLKHEYYAARDQFMFAVIAKLPVRIK